MFYLGSSLFWILLIFFLQDKDHIANNAQALGVH